MNHPAVRSPWLRLFVVAALYYAGAPGWGLRLAFPGSNASPVWPPAGLALAVLLLWGRAMWPAILVGAFAANLLWLRGLELPLPVALALAGAICAGNAAEAVLTRIRHAALVRRPAPGRPARPNPLCGGGRSGRRPRRVGGRARVGGGRLAAPEPCRLGLVDGVAGRHGGPHHRDAVSAGLGPPQPARLVGARSRTGALERADAGVERVDFRGLAVCGRHAVASGLSALAVFWCGRRFGSGRAERRRRWCW